MMKNFKFYSIAIVVFICSVTTYAQDLQGEKYTPDSTKFDSFIKDAFGESSETVRENKNNYWNTLQDLLENRLVYIKSSKEPSFYNFLSSVPQYNPDLKIEPNRFDIKKFNPFNYKMNIYNSNTVEYYKIDNTDFYILILPFKS